MRLVASDGSLRGAEMLIFSWNILRRLPGRMLELFRRHHISHGDLKGTNLLWSSELEVIDLDAIRWHNNQARWQRAYQKDCVRLQRNWQSDSAEHEYIAAVINSSS